MGRDPSAYPQCLAAGQLLAGSRHRHVDHRVSDRLSRLACAGTTLATAPPISCGCLYLRVYGILAVKRDRSRQVVKTTSATLDTDLMKGVFTLKRATLLVISAIAILLLMSQATAKPKTVPTPLPTAVNPPTLELTPPQQSCPAGSDVIYQLSSRTTEGHS